MKLINQIGDVRYYNDDDPHWIIKIEGESQTKISLLDYEHEMAYMEALETYKKMSKYLKGRPTFVWAYPGTGKTVTARNYVNFDDHDGPAINLHGCLSLINHAIPHGRNIVSSPFWKGNAEALYLVDEGVAKNGIDLDLVMCLPSTSCFSEYIERYNLRDDSPGFRRSRRQDFLENFEKYKKFELPNTKKIMLKPGQFLDEALIDNGVELLPS